ncbi:MAG: hypothetical protein ACKO3N_00360, partial [Verrucomicrobiota bacterium]
MNPIALQIILPLMAAGLPLRGLAQCSPTVPPTTGATSQNARAPIPNFSFMRAHYLVTAAEMAAAGFATGAQFNQIGWEYSTAPSSPATGNLKIYLQNTTDTGNTKSTDWTTAISTMTLASDDPAATLPG